MTAEEIKEILEENERKAKEAKEEFTKAAKTMEEGL